MNARLIHIRQLQLVHSYPSLSPLLNSHCGKCSYRGQHFEPKLPTDYLYGMKYLSLEIGIQVQSSQVPANCHKILIYSIYIQAQQQWLNGLTNVSPFPYLYAPIQFTSVIVYLQLFICTVIYLRTRFDSIRNQTNDNTINLSLREKRFVSIYDFGICETPVRYLRHALDAFEDK